MQRMDVDAQKEREHLNQRAEVLEKELIQLREHLEIKRHGLLAGGGAENAQSLPVEINEMNQAVDKMRAEAYHLERNMYESLKQQALNAVQALKTLGWAFELTVASFEERQRVRTTMGPPDPPRPVVKAVG